MALILLEGLDRTGKSTVAKEFKDQGYEVIHLSAPPKELSAPGYTGPSYLDQMAELIGSASIRDIVLDRTHYGELVWPHVYGRAPHLTEDDIEILREIEESVGVRRILMHDPNMEAHWQRCVDNKEPLTKVQFLKARQLYDRMATKYGFEKKTLGDFTGAPKQANSENRPAERPAASSVEGVHAAGENVGEVSNSGTETSVKSVELQKLEQANAINDVLAKRIIKSKGPAYDQLENDVRDFLKQRLGRIFGENQPDAFSKEEMDILKLFCQRLKTKETK